MNTDRKLKLLLFGATRHTGWHFMQQALDAGHEVTAIIRNPDAFTFRHDNLKVVKGDALQLNTFEGEMHGKDAVVSSLGVNPSDFRKATVICSQGVGNMMAAMQRADVKRIICISAMALDTNPQMGFFISTASKILQRILQNSFGDLRIMEAELKASNLNWTIVRPPSLKDNLPIGKYRVAVGSHLLKPWSINRADLAHYLNSIVSEQSTFRKTVEIAY